MKIFLPITLGVVAGCILIMFVFSIPKMYTSKHPQPFHIDIAKATADNRDFRHVLFTGGKSQLVVMSIPPGGEIGQETHDHTEQILYFQSGTGEAIMEGKTTPVGPGDVVVVTPGIAHNFRNTGTVPLQITTTYAPPNHIDGRIHRTKADADADLEDEAFGESHSYSGSQ